MRWLIGAIVGLSVLLLGSGIGVWAASRDPKDVATATTDLGVALLGGGPAPATGALIAWAARGTTRAPGGPRGSIRSPQERSATDRFENSSAR